MPDTLEATATVDTSPAETQEPVERAAPETTRKMNDFLRQGRPVPSDSSREPPSKSSQKPAIEEPSPDEPKAYTKEELNRIVQSETDRREARRNQEAKANQKREQERYLRQTNPQEYARLKETEENEQTSVQAVQQERLAVAESTMRMMDNATLDKMHAILPKKDADDVLKTYAHLQGIESRSQIASAFLERIVKNAKAEGAKEAESKLRGNPAFTKKIMAELRDELVEPESVPGVASPPPSGMNDWIRAATGRRRSI